MKAECLHTRFMNSTHASKKTSKPEFAPKTAKKIDVPACPACSCGKGFEVKMARVFECADCHALYGNVYLGDSYTYVLPYFSNAVNAPEVLDRQRYFDFDCLGSSGLTRRHGWFDPQTRLITQVG